MAIYFRGMSLDERVALTQAMTRSGASLDWRDINLPGPILDKHSTGGVGDNVSLMLAPMLAACGAYVPMISGRGLGHTGGTLDKLNSIPGYASQPDLTLFKRVVKEAGCAIIGQTADLAPADRRLYAIRDVTATVESVALITASILSKKLAAGLQGLVMDVKTGSGAFMATLDGARELATSIATVANDAGLPTVSLITDMNEPLASAAGNAVEIRNAVDYLTGARRDERLDRVTIALGAELLALSGLAHDVDVGAAALKRALESGAAAERFERMVAALGGPKDFISRAEKELPQAPVLIDSTPETRGFVTSIDVRAVGLAVVELGGGRSRAADEIDPAVGLTELAPIGAEVGPGAPLARVHARSADKAEAAIRRLRAAYRLDEAPLSPGDPVIERVAWDAAVSVLIAISGWDPKPWRTRMEALLPSHKIVMLDEPFDRESVRYALSWRHPPGALKDLPNLRVILSLGAGVDHLFADDALPDRPIVRVVDPDLTNRMNEWVVMHALVHLRQLRRYERQQGGRVWDDDDSQPKASDVQVGVLGLGIMGKDAVTKLKALGFKVAGWSASPKSLPDVTCFSGADGLKRMLAQTDMLVVLLPLTDATRGIINASLLSQLKHDGPLGGPILINAGRGGLQVEADILAALDSGALKGASLDVFEREPLPEDSRLWSHPAVYISPHNAAISSPKAIAALVARQIEADERGEPLAHLVDRRRGY